jgi:hypothetical protein
MPNSMRKEKELLIIRIRNRNTLEIFNGSFITTLDIKIQSEMGGGYILTISFQQFPMENEILSEKIRTIADNSQLNHYLYYTCSNLNTEKRFH